VPADPANARRRRGIGFFPRLARLLLGALLHLNLLRLSEDAVPQPDHRHRCTRKHPRIAGQPRFRAGFRQRFACGRHEGSGVKITATRPGKTINGELVLRDRDEL
jgi:hypothetical protein